MATIEVTTTLDIVAEDGLTSLREALTLAKDTTERDSIVFATALAGQTITLSGESLVLESDVSINGDVDRDRVADITVSGDFNSRLFLATEGSSTLRSLVLTKGVADAGGALRVEEAAIVNVWNSEFSGNEGYSVGGAISNSGTTNVSNSSIVGNYGAYGGGISNAGLLDIRNSTFFYNSTAFGGGAISNIGTMEVVNVTISDNFATESTGGGIYTKGIATIINSTIHANEANIGSGIDVQHGSPESKLTVVNSIVLGNSGEAENQIEQSVDANVTVTFSITGIEGEHVSEIFESGLTDNGGPVRTVALKNDVTNPALDAADESAAPPYDARDIRRVDRPLVENNTESVTDLGAFELSFFNQTGTTGPDYIAGDQSDNLSIFGGAGKDNLSGLGGNDIIDGGTGGDDLSGGDGNDVISDPFGDDRISGGAGNDEIRARSGKNSIFGGAGDDVIIGGIGEDAISADAGDDVIIADVSRIIFGNDGLTGGAGDDLLEGGLGADSFVFRPADGTDTIARLALDTATPQQFMASGADFQVEIDVIRLSGFGYEDPSDALDFVSNTDGHATFEDQGTKIVLFDILTADLTSDNFII